MHNYLRKYMCTFVFAQICDWEYNIYEVILCQQQKQVRKR
nr:MAG TPA: hypothetical protein [Bacteriophage sp.]